MSESKITPCSNVIQLKVIPYSFCIANDKKRLWMGAKKSLVFGLKDGEDMMMNQQLQHLIQGAEKIVAKGPEYQVYQRRNYTHFSLNRFSPVELIFSSHIWLNSNFHFLNMTDKIVDKTLKRYRLSCFIMSIKDLIQLYRDPKINFYHSCLSYNKSKFYYNIDESYEIL